MLIGQCSNTIKYERRKNALLDVTGTFSTCLETTYKRSKCLVLSRKVQDPSASRTKANVFPETSTMEQRSGRTDGLGSERDVGEGSFLQSFTSGRRISQSNISSREKGWGRKPSNQFKYLQQICALPAFQNGGFALRKYSLQRGDFMCKIDFKDAYFRVPLNKEFQKLVRFQWE